MEHAFLRELAERVFQQNQSGLNPDWKPDLYGITVVFPNRRAGLFFQKYLSGMIKKPIWAPEVTTLEDFTMELSSLQLADPLTLIFELYHAFNKYQQVPEPFERFYFWGEMLVKDFEELDRYLVDPEKLFISVKNQKELDEAFYFLDEKDKKKLYRCFGLVFFLMPHLLNIPFSKLGKFCFRCISALPKNCRKKG